MDSVSNNGFSDRTNLHQVAVTYSNPPREPKEDARMSPAHTCIQGIKLMQPPGWLSNSQTWCGNGTRRL